MTLLSEASFLVTPNGYKEDKLYAAIPTNGNGDMTVTRATTATRVNEAGLIELVPYNLLSRSEEFNNALWIKGSGVSATANTTIAPDGTLTADTLIGASSIDWSLSVLKVQPSTVFSSTTYTLSMYVKSLGSTTFQTSIRNNNAGGQVTVSHSINSDTWTRVEQIYTTTPTQTLVGIIFGGTDGDVAIWGAQFVEGSSAKTYQKTVDRLDIPRIDYTGGGCPSILLEPLRTNLLLNSATVVTQTRTTTAVANTLSFYGTGTITLSGTFAGTLVGTGASNRVSLTFTPTAGSLVLTVSGSCTNGQLEAGAYPTSYIPTVASTVTRNADVLSRNNIYTNNLIVGGGGTWFVHLINNKVFVRDASGNLFLDTASGGITNGINIRSIGTVARLYINFFTGGVNTFQYLTTADTVKLIIKWNGATADVFENGAKVVSATLFATTAMENLGGNGSDQPKYIKQMALFSKPLTEAQCIALTTL